MPSSNSFARWQHILRIHDGKIVQIAPEIEPSATEKAIDASGLTLLPAVIDPQVHFREPGLEYKEHLTTASRACAKDEVTSFLKMSNTRPITTNLAALDDR